MARHPLDPDTQLAFKHLAEATWDDEPPAVIATHPPQVPTEFFSAVLPVMPERGERSAPNSLLPAPGFGDEEERSTDVSPLSEFGHGSEPKPAKNKTLLLRMDGAFAGSVHALDRSVCLLGRESKCQIRVDDPTISRVHAKMVPDGFGWVLEDVGSQNGVFVQGRRISRAKLNDGDWIQLGPRVKFRFSEADQQEIELLQQLYESSCRDPLTLCHNRQYFLQRVGAEIAYAKRHQAPLSVVLLDIDHFKQVNDVYGHAAGDAALKQISKAVRQRLRTDDVLARYGGEEFAISLRGVDLRGCALVAERLRATVATVPVVFEGRYIPVTMSLGCASFGCGPEDTVEGLLAVADRRLYAAKRGGRNRVESSG